MTAQQTVPPNDIGVRIEYIYRPAPSMPRIENRNQLFFLHLRELIYPEIVDDKTKTWPSIDHQS
jgi:hypothetical protein